MIIWNLTRDEHPQSFDVDGGGRWRAGTLIHKPFSAAVAEYAQSLPEGEHLLGAASLSESSLVRDPLNPPMLRLVRVVRESAGLVTASVVEATIDPKGVS